jgi:hypothetical protein
MKIRRVYKLTPVISRSRGHVLGALNNPKEGRFLAARAIAEPDMLPIAINLVIERMVH